MHFALLDLIQFSFCTLIGFGVFSRLVLTHEATPPLIRYALVAKLGVFTVIGFGPWTADLPATVGSLLACASVALSDYAGSGVWTEFLKGKAAQGQATSRKAKQNA